MTVSADRAVGSLGRYHRVVSSRIPEADVVSEARFVMAASDERGLGLRLLGGVAVNLHAEPSLHPAFGRSYKDIDVVVPRRAGGEVGRLLVELGYESNLTFNAMNGNRRQLYYDVPTTGSWTSSSTGSRCATRFRCQIDCRSIASRSLSPSCC